MKIRVSNQSAKTVAVNTQGTSDVVAVGVQGPSGPNFLSSAADVDASVLENGSILVYKSSSLKWTATRSLEEQSLEGGHY